MTTNPTFRTRRALAVVAAAATVVTGCSGDDEPAADDDPNVDVLEEGDVNDESIGEALDDQGEVVDDVEIRFDDRSESISVGGLAMTIPALADYVTKDTDILAPPTWSTLALTALTHETEPFDAPSATFVVFSQTVAVTDDELRSGNEDQHWALAELTDVDPAHTSVTEGDGVTCRLEIRVDSGGNFGDIDRGHVLFSGPGLASSAMVVSGTPTTPSIGGLLADAVESACGSRPNGL